MFTGVLRNLDRIYVAGNCFIDVTSGPVIDLKLLSTGSRFWLVNNIFHIPFRVYMAGCCAVQQEENLANTEAFLCDVYKGLLVRVC